MKQPWPVYVAVWLTVLVSAVYSVQTRYLCGAQLADMLEHVCADRGFYRTRYRRSTSDEDIMHVTSETSDVQKRSIVNECCRKPCTISDLEGYCAPGRGGLEPERLIERFSPDSSSRGEGESQSQSDVAGPGISGYNNGQSQDSYRQRAPAQSRYHIRGRPSRLIKNMSYFFVTPARREYNLPDLA